MKLQSKRVGATELSEDDAESRDVEGKMKQDMERWM